MFILGNHSHSLICTLFSICCSNKSSDVIFIPWLNYSAVTSRANIHKHEGNAYFLNRQAYKLWKYSSGFIWMWKPRFPPYLQANEHQRCDSTSGVNVFKIQMDIGLGLVCLYVFFQSFKCSWCTQCQTAVQKTSFPPNSGISLSVTHSQQINSILFVLLIGI